MMQLNKILISFSLLFMISNVYSIPKKRATEEFPLADVQRFSTALGQIKHYYVKSVNDKELFENAIRGMLTNLDPHSDYLNEEDFEALTTTSRGNFGGLGIEVTMENGIIKVVSPIDDTPAYQAGIKAGDYIIALDEKPIRGMTLKEAVSKMRGEKGSPINLTVLRKSEKKPLKIKVTRDIIKIKSISSQLYEKQYGYLRIKHFQEPTAKDMKSAVKKLKKDAKGKLAGLVIDLRNNPGGLLDSAIEIADSFIHHDNKQKNKKRLIVYTKGRIDHSKTIAYATPGDLIKGAPIVVLINEGSASGSEIVAGALKDNKRAVLVGKKTFGKGSVQTVLPLDESHAIKLTTALYYTPNGISIQAEGIKPDIEIEMRDIPKKKESEFKAFTEADLMGHLKNASESREEKGNPTEERLNLLYKDYQLHEALNLLKGMHLAKKTGIH